MVALGSYRNRQPVGASNIFFTDVMIQLVFDRRKQTACDTIRDAILTCARERTWVGLIYRTEPTTKKRKTEKLKSKNKHAQKQQ